MTLPRCSAKLLSPGGAGAFVALGGGYGMAKAKQKKKERAIQQVMGGCLKERGYEVAGWSRAPKVRKQ